MKVLIVEDEPGVAQNLCDLLQETKPGIEILAVLESVEETVSWINDNSSPDLGFFDIRLADGNSFEIFEKVVVSFPVIFTTAYDEFALKAFKVNSIDYLLKPIDRKEIIHALEKYRSIYKQQSGMDYQKLINAIGVFRQNRQGKFKKNLLVYRGDRIIPVDVNDISYFQVRDELVYCITHQNKSHNIDQTLEKIMGQVDPELFFRANRQFIVSREGVKSVTQYFNRKLLLYLEPEPGVEVLVSKSRVTEFKNWLAG